MFLFFENFLSMLPKLVTFYLICSYYIIYLYLASSTLVVREVDQIWIFFKIVWFLHHFKAINERISEWTYF